MSFEYKPCHEELLKTIAHTWLILRRKVKKMMDDMGLELTLEQVLVLLILKKEDGLTLGILAEKADRERTTISRMVDGLEKLNLVLRVPGQNDKRKKLIYLTKSGKQLNGEMYPFMLQFSESVYQGINENKVSKCLTVLQEMLDNLERN